MHSTAEKTVTVNIEGSTYSRFTLAVSIAMDGTKLPLFVIFKKSVVENRKIFQSSCACSDGALFLSERIDGQSCHIILV